MASKREFVPINSPGQTTPADKRFKNKLAKEVEKLSPAQQKMYGKAFEAHGGPMNLRENYQQAHDKGMEAARKIK